MPAVVQLTSYLIDFGMDVEEAMHAPRIDSSLADVTIADDTFPQDIQGVLKQVIPTVIFAPRTAYPFNFACPSMVGRKNKLNEGATEVMSHWADTVSEEV